MNKLLIIRIDEDGFSVYPKERPPDEAIELIQHHSDRLRALLDKPVILQVTWEDGDDMAVVRIMPVSCKHPDEPFETIELRFPTRSSTAIRSRT